MMLDMPQWLRNVLSSLQCPHCKESLHHQGITAVGVRCSTQRSPTKTVMFLEYLCPSCEELAILEMNPMTLQQFCRDMAQAYMKDRASGPRKPRCQHADRNEGSVVPSVLPGTPMHPISLQEIRHFRQSLRRLNLQVASRSWRHFLRRLDAERYLEDAGEDSA